MISAMAHILPTPCPHKTFHREKNSITALDKWADDYFDHIACRYPRPERSIMHSMFHKESNVFVSDDLLSTSRTIFAETAFDIETCCCPVTIDKHLHQVPLLKQWMSIHEIGSHVPHNLLTLGRMMKPYGPPAGMDYEAFSELSAAICEYHFIRPIHADIIADQISRIQNPSLEDGKKILLDQGIKENVAFIQNNSVTEYLQHRNESFYHFDQKNIALFSQNLERIEKRDNGLVNRIISAFRH